MHRREFCAATGIAFTGGCLRLQDSTDEEREGSETAENNKTRDVTATSTTETKQGVEDETTGFPDEPALQLREAWTTLDRGEAVRMVNDQTLVAGQNESRTTDTGDRITVGGIASISPDGRVEWRRYEERTFGKTPVRWLDGEIYAGESGLSPEASARADADPAIAVSLTSDGNERWRFETDEALSAVSPVLPETVVVGTALLEDGDGRGGVYALDRETGDVLWEKRIDGEYPQHIGADGRAVYVKLWNELRSYNVETGEEQWRIDARSAGPNDLQVVDGTVYTSYTNELRAHATTDGDLVWTGEMFNPLSAPLVTTDETVFAGSTDTGVYAFDAGTGERRWRHQADAEPVGLSVENDRVWVTTEEDTILALSTDGEPLFRMDIEDDISINTHATAGGRLVATGVYRTVGYLIENT